MVPVLRPHYTTPPSAWEGFSGRERRSTDARFHDALGPKTGFGGDFSKVRLGRGKRGSHIALQSSGRYRPQFGHQWHKVTRPEADLLGPQKAISAADRLQDCISNRHLRIATHLQESGGALKEKIPELMRRALVPGLSIFTTQGGVENVSAFGVRNTETGAPVDAQTVFEAASLSKPVVANAALQLIDAGKLDLDEPLSRFAGQLVPDDPASASITARHVLSHTTGLPNWRRTHVPLRTYFPPGSRFSYSGEGFVYLQSALERITGDPLDVILRRSVLDPLGMSSSSFVWRDSFSEKAAFGHDSEGKVEAKFRPDQANAAFSLHTTASDYGRFVVAAMEGTLLSAKTASLWMEAQIPTPRGRFEALESSAPATETGVYWGLGWGVEPDAKASFHWGANPGMTAFVMAMPTKRTAFVVFMNSDTGLSIVPEIVDYIMPGQHPALSWLGLLQQS